MSSCVHACCRVLGWWVGRVTVAGIGGDPGDEDDWTRAGVLKSLALDKSLLPLGMGLSLSGVTNDASYFSALPGTVS